MELYSRCIECSGNAASNARIVHISRNTLTVKGKTRAGGTVILNFKITQNMLDIFHLCVKCVFHIACRQC